MSETLVYDFLTPPKIAFGCGRRHELGTIARSLGRRAFVVCGSKTLESAGVIDELLDSLRDAKIVAEPLGTISREPEVTDVDRFADNLCRHQPSEGDFVLAVGGGSAIDLGKAIAALATNRATAQALLYFLTNSPDRALVTARPWGYAPQPPPTGIEAAAAAVWAGRV